MSANACQTTIRISRPKWDSDCHEGRLCLTLSPDIDWQDTRRIRQFIARHNQLQVVACDCRHVDITSTAAIGWLVTLYRWCEQQRLGFSVINPDAHSMADYRARGLQNIIPIAA